MDSHHLLFAGLPAHPIPAVRNRSSRPLRALSGSLLAHLVGASEERCRHSQAERLGEFHVFTVKSATMSLNAVGLPPAHSRDRIPPSDALASAKSLRLSAGISRHMIADVIYQLKPLNGR